MIVWCLYIQLTLNGFAVIVVPLLAYFFPEPTFISAFVASRPEDPMNEKIYVLFREKNSDNSPEADPWISRVARVCKVQYYIFVLYTVYEHLIWSTLK